MKKRIFSVALVVCAVLCMGLYKGTFAWFRTDYQSSSKINFIVGDVAFDLSCENPFAKGGEKEGQVIVPGDVVLNNIELVNKSTIKTNLRIKVEFSVFDSSGNDCADVADFDIKFADNSWKKLGSSEYYTYCANTEAEAFLQPGIVVSSDSEEETTESESTTISSEETTQSEGTAVPFIDKIVCKETAKIKYSNAKLIIKITFQAKQADDATWENIGAFKSTSE